MSRRSSSLAHMTTSMTTDPDQATCQIGLLICGHISRDQTNQGGILCQTDSNPLHLHLHEYTRTIVATIEYLIVGSVECHMSRTTTATNGLMKGSLINTRIPDRMPAHTQIATPDLDTRTMLKIPGDAYSIRFCPSHVVCANGHHSRNSLKLK